MLPTLLRERNRSLTWLKIAARTMSPSTDGSAPGSPDRSRPTYAEKAPPTVRRSTSREKSPAGRSLWLGSPPAIWLEPDEVVIASDALVGRCRCQPDVAASSRGDELDDLGGVAVLGQHFRGDPAEIQRRHPVSDL